MNIKKRKNRQHNIILHQYCVNQLEKMYEDNKNIYKLYQEILQKNIYLNELNKRSNKKIEKLNEDLENKNIMINNLEKEILSFKKNNNFNKHNEDLINN